MTAAGGGCGNSRIPSPGSQMTVFAQRAMLLLLALTLPSTARAQQPAGDSVASPSARPAIPTYSFSFERPGLPVPSYILVVAQDGTARYSGNEVTQAEQASDQAATPQPFSRQFDVSPATVKKIADLTRTLHNFSISCASKAKNVADTGKKRLTYLGPDGQGSCTYNYSENKDVQALTNIFQGIAETLDQGRELDHLRRYDRLGLDAAITFFAQEVTEGRALEIGAIAASLRSIADDPQVMDRVRARASTLLALAPADYSR